MPELIKIMETGVNPDRQGIFYGPNLGARFLAQLFGLVPLIE
jgi:hypothetical protein